MAGIEPGCGPSPRRVCQPMVALMICIAAMNGSVRNLSANLGVGSNAAGIIVGCPVTRPGPSKRTMLLGVFERRLPASLLHVPSPKTATDRSLLDRNGALSRSLVGQA
jgi:uncharacterized membrane protein